MMTIFTYRVSVSHPMQRFQSLTLNLAFETMSERVLHLSEVLTYGSSLRS